MLIVRGQYIQRPKTYSVWFCPGGGGNWLNYLIWAWKHNKIIPGKHAHFSAPILSSVDPEYELVVNFLQHDESPLTNRADIVFGSTRAWYNQWYMNVVKNQTSSDNLGHDFKNMNLKFNLDWADIVEDPENFLRTLNSIIGEEIKFNSIVEQVWLQYLENSYPPGVQGLEYLDNPIFDTVLDNIYNTQTNIEDSVRARFQHTREIFDTQWIKCTPSTWTS